MKFLDREPNERHKPSNGEVRRAKAAFDPKEFGFKPYGKGWKKTFEGVGEVAIAPISWEHAQFPSLPMGDGRQGNALDLVSKLQEEIWAMPASEAVPTNVASIVKNTGGSILVAYKVDKGFTAEGALGFSLAFGGSQGRLVSHMVGVREQVRSTADLGWYLKIIQAHEALKTGHTSMEWTYDPMRGANARLNIEKLGGRINDFTIDKYGKISSDLYGDVPTDRFTVTWDLLSPSVHERVRDVYEGKFKALGLDDIKKLPHVTGDNMPQVAAKRPAAAAYEIPGDIDSLMAQNEGDALSWRREMRKVFSGIMNTHEATVPKQVDPALSTIKATKGDYSVDGFATGVDSGKRRSFYRLKRK